MKATCGSAFWSALLATALCHLVSAQGSNTTQGKPSPQSSRQFNWRDGPQERGTLGLIWSCLATIIACTWTILHLNVPRAIEGSRAKLVRKVKWMAVTILFPEFIFSKAVCELQSAVYDLRAMSEVSDLDQWRVEFDARHQILFRLFNTFDQRKPPKKPREEPQPVQTEFQGKRSPEEVLGESRRTWTLTHSYFANMGGLVLGGKDGLMMPVTAQALVDHCKSGKRSFLGQLKLSADEIRDKSKADWFSKAIAFAQIFWLVISVIVRAIRNMPVTQLEICTVSFAALAMATYIANFSKPKDVDKPMIIEWDERRQESRSKDGKHEEPFFHREESFFRRLLQPRKIHGDREDRDKIFLTRLRIKNDYIRKGSKITDVPLISYWLAVSTIIFGGMHCIAWTSEFPTHAEKLLWIISSCLSATLPLINLVFNDIMLSWRTRSSFRAVAVRLKHLAQRQVPEATAGKMSSYRYGVVYFTAEKRPVVSMRGLHEAMLELFNDTVPQLFAGTTPSAHMLTKFMGQYERAKLAYTRLQSTVPSLKFDRQSIAQQGVKCLDDCGLRNKNLWRRRKDLILVMDLLEQSDVLDIMRKPLREMRWTNRPGRIMTICSGIIYVVVRIVILALAFATLRHQEDGVYIETWTKNLPSFS